MDPQHGAVYQLIANCLLISAAVVCTASVVLHLRVTWWRSEMGRHLLAYMGVMALTLDLGVVRIFFGDSSWFQLVRLIVFVGVPLVMTQRLWLQIKAQRESSAEEATTPIDRDH